MSIEELRNLYEEIKDFKDIVQEYYEMKHILIELENSAKWLKEEKSKLQLNDIYEKIRLLEQENDIINKEIELVEIKEGSCDDINSIKRVIHQVESEEICFQKSVSFFKSLIASYLIKNKFIIEIKEIKTDFIKVVKISRSLEEFFQLINSKSFYNEILQEYKEILKFELNDSLPSEIVVMGDTTYLYILSSANDEDDLHASNLSISSLKKLNIIEIYNSYQIVIDSFLQLLKYNLNNRIVPDEIDVNLINENNRIFINTPYYISFTDDYLLDILIKSIMNECRHPVSSDGVVKSFNFQVGKIISSNYALIRKSLKLFITSQSKRKEKGKSVLINSLIKFFNRTYNDNSFHVVLYSDIIHLIYEFSNFLNESNQNVSYFYEIKKDIFNKIIKHSTILTIDLSNTVIINKMLLKGLKHDLKENLEVCLTQKETFEFYISFFDSLFNEFTKFVLSIHYYSESDKIQIKELADYLIELSFGVSKKNMNSYNRFITVYDMFNLSLTEISNLYRKKRIYLENYEFKLLLKLIFSSSHELTNLLERL